MRKTKLAIGVVSLLLKGTIAVYALSHYTEIVEAERQKQVSPILATEENALKRIVDEELVSGMLLALTDNGGKSQDRYSAYFGDGSVLRFSEQPDKTSAWEDHYGEINPNNDALLILNTFHLKGHILDRVRDAYRDYVKFCRASNASDREMKATILAEYKKLKKK